MKNNLTQNFLRRYFDPALDLRVQSFNLLGFAGFAAGIVVAAVSLFNGVDLINIALNLAASALAYLLLRLTGKKLYSDAACANEIASKTMTLAVGANTAYVKVTAEDGSTKVYTITVTRQSAPNPGDVSVAGITISGGTSISTDNGTVQLTAVITPANATNNLYRQKATRYCTAHYITHKALYQLVLDDIRRNAAIAKQCEDELSDYAQRLASGNANHKYKRVQKELDKCIQRSGELDTIIKKLFEQNALGVISDERFLSMSADYEKKQSELSSKIAELKAQLEKRDAEGSNTTKFLNAVRKYSDITELDAAILNDLIDSIVVYDAEGRSRKNRVQRVEINYKFIGLMQMDERKSA
ncbi:MAG: DUF4368 domain-containing protein [Oscillospiraceae bacterium]|jgi:hypothetical protein|nr:DUF4368 domain-containing protein [Oscillospiraceae bacterium]